MSFKVGWILIVSQSYVFIVRKLEKNNDNSVSFSSVSGIDFAILIDVEGLLKLYS